MGYGSYSVTDWTKLRKSRSIGDEARAKQIFVSNKMKDKYNPLYIAKREARDSELHPNSTPIVIGVDVTGSMDYLSEKIIKSSLHELMQQLYSTDLIPDPQIMFAAIGDAVADSAPLQVTQFESDIRIAEQLLELWLENGGGDAPEDYELLWYFVCKHTEIDSFKKRNKKGFCFTIGDANCHTELRATSIKKIFDDRIDGDSLESKQIFKEASKTYNVFHIKIGEITSNLDIILPGNVLYINKNDIGYLPEIIISVMLMCNGMSKDMVLDRLGENSRKVVKNSISRLVIVNNGVINF